MSERFSNPPIVEAVVDIDCDMPPAADLGTLEEPARAALQDRYPKMRTQLRQEHIFQAPADSPPKFSVRTGLQAFQFLQEDEKQLVQLRTGGFSFNRLAPYSSLDDYLPEIERTWHLFLNLASSAQVRNVRLRYINRILLPLERGQVDLDAYLRIGPRLPEEQGLTFTGFLDRHSLFEKATGNRVDVILATQPEEAERLPIILDIQAVANVAIDPKDWAAITAHILSLRSLKNLVFQRTLSEQCLKLFER